MVKEEFFKGYFECVSMTRYTLFFCALYSVLALTTFFFQVAVPSLVFIVGTALLSGLLFYKDNQRKPSNEEKFRLAINATIFITILTITLHAISIHELSIYKEVTFMTFVNMFLHAFVIYVSFPLLCRDKITAFDA